MTTTAPGCHHILVCWYAAPQGTMGLFRTGH